MARPRVEVVHVGSACRDVVPEDPRGWRLGGGVTYASLTTARLGLRTAAIVGVDATAATASELDMLRDAGVDLLLVPLDGGPDLPQPRDADGPGPDLGGDRGAAAGPGRPRVVARGAGLVAGPGRRRGDRRLGRRGPGRRPPRRGVAGLPARAGRRASRSAAGRRGRRRSCAAPTWSGSATTTCRPRRRSPTLYGLLHPGADLLVTQGSRGRPADPPRAATARPRSLRYLPTATDRETDPTGAGDTFLAALQASILRPAVVGRRRSRHRLDLRFAAAAGSLVVEGPGLDGVPDRTAVLVRRARERIRGRWSRRRSARWVRSRRPEPARPWRSGSWGRSGRAADLEPDREHDDRRRSRLGPRRRREPSAAVRRATAAARPVGPPPSSPSRRCSG